MTAPRLLVVSPAFHGYWESIQRAFEKLGHEVRTHRYDARDLHAKLTHKISVELPARLGRDTSPLVRHEVTASTIHALRDFRPQVVLAVKGDLLDTAFHDAAADQRARTAVWVYDELPNTAFTRESLAAFDSRASYSGRDCATVQAWGLSCALVPDAFDPDIPVTAIPTGEIVQIGAKYPARVEALLALAAAGLPVRSYGREWSRHPYDVARTWGGRRPAVPGGREMSRAQAMGLMAGAPAALNVHGSHDGFNMRTFEAAGAGALQLIDRTDVGELYEPGREIVPFTSVEELVEAARRALADPAWSAAIRRAGRKRTLAEHTFKHRARALEDLWD